MDTAAIPRSAIIRFAALFVPLSLTALIGLEHWVDSLLEAGLIFAVFSLVFSHRPLLTALGRAPRTLQISAIMMGVLWAWSQVHEVAIETYPFISWRMYGEPPKTRDVAGYRLLGERCTGEEIVLPSANRATGRRPVLFLAVRRAHEESLQATGNPTRTQQRIDRMMQALMEQWNRRSPGQRLCALSLQRASLDLERTTGTAGAHYVTVRRHAQR